jgi:hypothetical protein
MPKLSKFRESYDYYSGKLSEIGRNLAFAGIAVIWIFKKNDSSLTIDEKLVLPLLLFVITLTFDFLHYSWATIIWGYFTRSEEKKLTNAAVEDPNLVAPAWYNWPSIFFFASKSLSIILGYIFLFCYLIKILT